jgi:GTPase
MARPLVAVVGRPNVGKSSLFNRVIGKRKAVVDPAPGVTRDRVSGEAEWAGHEFVLVDTGGLVPGSSNPMEQRIGMQVEAALEEADVVVFITDVQSGLTDLDQAVARQLRRVNRPFLLLVNKVDTQQWESDWHDFYALGLGEPIPVSAMSGRHVGDMLDLLVDLLPPKTSEPETRTGIKVALLGRPNVGKSSLVNSLVGAEKVVVDNVPGTTRDTTDTTVTIDGTSFTLIDTAGLRRHKARYRDKDTIEYFSVIRTVSAIERCDVGVVLIDSMEHLVKQDIDVIDQVIEAGKALVIVANKWDLVPNKTTDTAGMFVKELRSKFPRSTHYPLVLISATTKQRIHRVLLEAAHVYEVHGRRVDTSNMNDWLAELNRTKPIPGGKAGFPKVNYVTQVAVRPPTFVFFVNDPAKVSDQAERYVERAIREKFDFVGTPIKLKFRRKNRTALDEA